MKERIPGFRGEYLWELDVPQIQLLALAEAIPADRYGWRPAEDARSVSEVLVHVAAGSFLLLRLAGIAVPDGEAMYTGVQGDRMAQLVATVRINRALEKSLTEKAAVIDLLRRSLDAVRSTFQNAPEAEIERTGPFFGETTTVRRVYMRMLAHTHEHMGQVIAYARMMGIRMPWPDPLQQLEAAAKAKG